MVVLTLQTAVSLVDTRVVPVVPPVATVVSKVVS